MRVTARLVFVLYILFCFMVLAQDVKKKEDSPKKPALTADQKLEIRNAQVEAFQAKTMLESTPQYKAFVSAQDQMNQVALKVQRDSGCVPPDWQFTQNLECVAVPKPEPEKQ